ncbi:MAG TPA: 4a-hydroxytetrahydrobiopterin dehydratase [Acidimicrobiales bacterium]|nr:4a-hydroxytetrahydrobiopterin dehydratase [Acidimicrobiales bacterium]
MVEVLDESAVAAGLAGLAWERDGDEIVKTVGRKDFAEAMVLVNQVAELAEAADHHPDIAISWNKVTLRLSTHSAGGITAKDLELAERIDRLG